MINIDKDIIDLYKAGYRIKDICDKLNINYGEVNRTLHDARVGHCRASRNKKRKATITWEEHKKKVNGWNRKNREKTTKGRKR